MASQFSPPKEVELNKELVDYLAALDRLLMALANPETPSEEFHAAVAELPPAREQFNRAAAYWHPH